LSAAEDYACLLVRQSSSRVACAGPWCRARLTEPVEAERLSPPRTRAEARPGGLVDPPGDGGPRGRRSRVCGNGVSGRQCAAEKTDRRRQEGGPERFNGVTVQLRLAGDPMPIPWAGGRLAETLALARAPLLKYMPHAGARGPLLALSLVADHGSFRGSGRSLGRSLDRPDSKGRARRIDGSGSTAGRAWRTPWACACSMPGLHPRPAAFTGAPLRSTLVCSQGLRGGVPTGRAGAGRPSNGPRGSDRAKRQGSAIRGGAPSSGLPGRTIPGVASSTIAQARPT